MNAPTSLRRVASVARKETLHLLRDPGTLFFALAVPLVEMFLLGYAIETNVRHVRTVVYDEARTAESRELLRAFVNSEVVDVVGEAFSDEELSQHVVAGTARAAIKIPEDYSRALLAGRTAEVLVVVDGSVSSTAAEVINVGNAVALRESLGRALGGRPLPVECRPKVLFNPDTRTANFFLPGLLVVMIQMMATMLTANALVREKENGTLEQLFLTPVRPGELIAGKLVPYLGLAAFEFVLITFLMVTVFGVPMNGSPVVLAALALPFVIAMLGLGLAVSAGANSKEEAGHAVMGTIIPAIFLSGYVFPTDSMPAVFQTVAQVIPTTWLIDAARGVILRGAGWPELATHFLVMWAMAAAALAVGVLRFGRRV